MSLDDIVMEIKKEEGFRGDPYLDHLDNPTIGYGTLLPLSKAESVLLLRHRLLKKQEELMVHEVYRQANHEVRSILLSMAYQMGTNGVMKFRKMLKAIANHDYKEAAIEMLDSTWAVQTPGRAQRLAETMREIKD